MSQPLSRRNFVIGSSAALAVSSAAEVTSAAVPAEEVMGPLLGHVDDTTAHFWARIASGGEYTLELRTVGDGSQPVTSVARFTERADFTGHWSFADLQPATKYRYRLLGTGGEIEGHFHTAPSPAVPSKVSLVLGSCATEDEGSRGVWRRILAEKVDGLVLCGDTPYIDSTDLTKQRQRYRAFSAVPEFQGIAKSLPVWGTWDDHDFGKNDADGRLKGKENALQAFKEYRANANFGENGVGIFTKFRFGPVEVFLIDARWFANTGPSPVDEKKPTLLGKAQFDWLLGSLKASTSPWKVLLTGIIWDAKTNGEKDHWETYAHERRAIFDFIRQEKINGVVLFGGDIHVTRVLRYDAEKTVGYPLYQFISSPIHDRILPKLNNPHPDLIHSAVKPHTFLKLTCDSTVEDPTLTARFLNSDGDLLFEEIKLSLKQTSHAV
ncbi:alkaline phosphatase [Anatilimnocola sp. NA78]|uniref:alkaline phosphatase D family protein n=1 Tax=Anatilimnocola sp. NA78 TaxID=3415683 RepID=UPI003CE460CB